MLLANLLLALTWLALTGQWTVVNFALGFVVGALLLGLLPREDTTRSGYLSRLGRWLRFALFVGWELLLANLRVSVAILRPRIAVRPAVVAVPLSRDHTDASLTLLANLITLTPGSMSLDVSDDRSILYVHTYDVASVASFRREIVEAFERRVLEVST